MEAVGFKTAIGTNNSTAMKFRSRNMSSKEVDKIFASTQPWRGKEWLRTEKGEDSWGICLKRPKPVDFQLFSSS
ncbi:MAG: hypothetical protein OXI01_05820 [Albidovulum sp.]|nr:hypothetical protein [Albidovulum sp.]